MDNRTEDGKKELSNLPDDLNKFRKVYTNIKAYMDKIQSNHRAQIEQQINLIDTKGK